MDQSTTSTTPQSESAAQPTGSMDQNTPLSSSPNAHHATTAVVGGAIAAGVVVLVLMAGIIFMAQRHRLRIRQRAIKPAQNFDTGGLSFRERESWESASGSAEWRESTLVPPSTVASVTRHSFPEGKL